MDEALAEVIQLYLTKINKKGTGQALFFGNKMF